MSLACRLILPGRVGRGAPHHKHSSATDPASGLCGLGTPFSRDTGDCSPHEINPGPIYLYVPETDVEAYERSIDRLATMVAQLDILLASHNLPVSRPEMLLRLAHAFRQVQTGNAPFTIGGAQREYRFDAFSLLLANK